MMSKKFKSFLAIILLALLLYIFEMINISFVLNYLIEKVWYKIFKRIYEYSEPDYTVDDKNAKYVLYECTEFCGGWGDRLKGIMSAYAWSLLTNRQFRIYMSHPCNINKAIIPNSINWNSKLTRNGVDIQLDSGHSRSYLNYIDSFDFKFKLINLNVLNYKSDKDILIIRNNFDWLDSFSMNKHLEDRISNIGYLPEKFKLVYLFKEWYEKLFKLTPVLQIKYNSFLNESKPSNLTKIICAQVRIGGRRPHVKFDHVYNDIKVTQLFWNFIRENFIKTLGHSDYKIFITTDTESVETEAIEEFGNDRIVKIPGLFTHIDRESFLGDDCSRVEKTLLDFHFMQNCDMGLISDSGFGKLGLWNRNEPIKDLYLFNNNEFKKVNYNVVS